MNMPNTEIRPDKITKPMQLLAGWLAGLILTNSGFLIAAANISEPKWVAGALVIAAIANVPLFLAALFLLQTKFRPHIQEDRYFSEYLKEQAYVQNYHRLELKLGDTSPQLLQERAREIRAAQEIGTETKPIQNSIRKK